MRLFTFLIAAPLVLLLVSSSGCAAAEGRLPATGSIESPEIQGADVGESQVPETETGATTSNTEDPLIGTWSTASSDPDIAIVHVYYGDGTGESYYLDQDGDKSNETDFTWGYGSKHDKPVVYIGRPDNTWFYRIEGDTLFMSVNDDASNPTEHKRVR